LKKKFRAIGFRQAAVRNRKPAFRFVSGDKSKTAFFGSEPFWLRDSNIAVLPAANDRNPGCPLALVAKAANGFVQ